MTIRQTLAGGVAAALVLTFVVHGLHRALGTKPVQNEANALQLIEVRGGAVSYRDDGHVWMVELAGTDLSDADLQVLVDLHAVSRLHLMGTSVSDEGCRTIVWMRGQKLVDLRGTGVTAEGAEYLRTMRPEWTVVYDEDPGTTIP